MKNILLIITDTFRYDNLGDKGKNPVKTPNLDKFAQEKATSIDNFYTGSFPTIPHRTDLATGVLGWPHYGWQSIKKSSSNHIAAILSKAGYVTQLICDCPHLFNSEFEHDFDAAFQHRGQAGDKPLLHLNDEIKNVVSLKKVRPRPTFKGHPLVDQHRWINRYFQYEAETFAAKTARTAIRWLEENSEINPFFLWTDFFDPHEPWDPPEYLVKHYHSDYEGESMLHSNYGHASDYNPDELKNLWAHYAAETELVDRHIGRIFQKLDDLNLWQDTIVIVTSDHGTNLGEHDRTGKSNINENDERYWPIYPEVGHVPFLIAGGDIPKGVNLNLMAQPVDILPTLSKLAKVPLTLEQEIQGNSFAKQLLNGDSTHRDYVVSGCNITSQNGTIPKYVNTPFLVTDEWGYSPVGSKGGLELYDMTVDPLTKNNIAKGNEKISKKLQNLFITYLHKVGADKEFISLWKRRI